MLFYIPCGLASVSRDAGGVDYRLIPWHLPHVLIASLHHISIANHVHREALVPVFLLCRDTLGAKVCHAVDQAVDLARVSFCDCLQIQSSFSSSPPPPLMRRAEPDGWIMDTIFINHMYLLLSAVTRTDFYTSVIVL